MSANTTQKTSRNKLSVPKWNHQHDLEKLKGKHVDVWLSDGRVLTAILLDSDAYTIKLRLVSEHKSELTVGGDWIFFKHAISGVRSAG